MEKNEYALMFSIEDTYWWYKALRDIVFRYIGKESRVKNDVTILDAGCGTGGLLAKLGKYETYGFDFSEEAIKFCEKRGLDNVVFGSVLGIPFNDKMFDIAISMDVLSHANVGDENLAFNEISRVLKPDGIMILNLPAYQWLRSSHDRSTHTERRYTVSALKKTVEKAGFSIEKITYRNTLLFPVSALVRLFKNVFNREDVESDLGHVNPVINKVLLWIMLFENKLLKNMNMPFGLSVFCVARKKEI